MQSIQINGTFTFAENIKNLKIGEQIKLIKNPNNKINNEAIGAYTMDGKKIGYIPFTSNQINIKSKCYVSKINLSQLNPILLIDFELEMSNFITKFSYENKIIKINDSLSNDINKFKKFLEKAGNKIDNINVTYLDENFINLQIDSYIFYTVTRKYYEENIFKYDEFYKLNLIPHCIYLPFQIHRLECYIERNYKSINELLKSKKIKKVLSEYISENNLIKINENINSYFNNLKTENFCYNHEIKSYCNIDFYNDENLVEIYKNEIEEKYLIVVILKSIIANKKYINIYNPKDEIIYKLEISDEIKENIFDLIKN